MLISGSSSSGELAAIVRSFVRHFCSGFVRNGNGNLETAHDDTDQHRQSTGRNRPPSYWDLAKFFYFLQTTLVDCDGNRADLPVSISFDALQHRGAAESDRRFKHHSTVQPSLFQADYHVGQ